MSEYKDKYWNTLIQLQDSRDKEMFQDLCKELGISPSKVMGSMISRFIKQQQEKVKDE